MKQQKIWTTVVVLTCAVLIILVSYHLAHADAAPPSATCTPTSWHVKTAVHDVRCSLLGRCTGRLSTCGPWGCAYGALTGPRSTVYEGRRVWAQVSRSASCRYGLRAVGR